MKKAAGSRPGDAPVWLLLGRGAGDNAQIEALAGAAGAPARAFRLSHNLLREAPNALLGGTLATLRADPGFAPPWPALVIGAGRRNAPVGRWIARASGGRARLVWIGRPRAPLDWFDLALTTPQYGMAAGVNVMRLSLPFDAGIAPAPGPRRFLAALGGPSWSASLGPDFIRRFARAAREEAGRAGLPLSLATSPRTPAGAGAILRDALGDGAEIHDWRAQAGAANPYRDWLREAGGVLVSGDSVSLISDAVGSGAPVAVLAPPAPGWIRALRASGPGRRWLASGGRGFLAPPPDIGAVTAHLEAQGLARRDGDLIRVEAALPAIRVEREAAAARVRALLHR
ncbi:MAG: ELM1/GtrOC1 family putative glycosyltransferase [Pikeienuella sp.]